MTSSDTVSDYRSYNSRSVDLVCVLFTISGTILGMGLANEIRRYIVAISIIGEPISRMIPEFVLAIDDFEYVFADLTYQTAWWRHPMETFSALLALCAGNSTVTGEFPSQRPVSRSFDVFFDLRLNKRLSKQSWGWCFETPSRSVSRHCNGLTRSRDILGHLTWSHTKNGSQARKDGKMILGESSPANPTLKLPVPLSMMIGVLSLPLPTERFSEFSSICENNFPCKHIIKFQSGTES